MDFSALKSAFLTLDPLKQISCSKRIHGCLNTGAQKKHISPTATDAHLCPRCKLHFETQDHVLQCPHSSAHKRRYELLFPMKRRILTNPGCKVQQLFFDCLRKWLARPDNISPDISHLPMAQRTLVALALTEQQAIGWDLCFRGYLSRHWALAVAAHPSPPTSTQKTNATPLDLGSLWARKTINLLWEFAHDMWIHRNSFLHDPTNTECCNMKGAAVNAEITALYNKVDSYSAQDRWRFDMPLALRLRTPLRSRRRWLALTKILTAKSTNIDPRGQSRLTTYFQVVRNLRPQISRLRSPPSSQSSGGPLLAPPPLSPFLTGRRPQDPASRSL